MPVITITLIEGYEADFKSSLCKTLGNVAKTYTGAPPDGVTVMVNEVKAENYMRAGLHRQTGPPPLDARDIVKTFLTAMQQSDLDASKKYLHENFEMTFPGSVTMQRLEELIDWAKHRYQSIGKQYERFDRVFEEENSIVYCYGTLEGKWLDGSSFSGIRFIDRFVVQDGKLLNQQVWNDLAETRT